MQLDFTQLKSKFEKITSLRPMSHREYVELYIKAYYLPENSFEEWIKEHKVFTYINITNIMWDIGSFYSLPKIVAYVKCVITSCRNILLNI